MRTLDAAWAWYVATREGARRWVRLAPYWDDLPWGSDAAGMVRLRTDNVLSQLQTERIVADARAAEEGLDDLAVLVLFSVFEATVREWVRDRVGGELDRLREPGRDALLRKTADDLEQAIREGSFGRLLEPYKAPVGAGLVEEVNQVRRYRNWVAHGRREDGAGRANVTPELAYDRLARFLAALRGAA